MMCLSSGGIDLLSVTLGVVKTQTTMLRGMRPDVLGRAYSSRYIQLEFLALIGVVYGRQNIYTRGRKSREVYTQ